MQQPLPMTDLKAGARSEDDVPWGEARAFFERILGARLTLSDRDELKDLVQECLIRLLRAVRREPANHLEALMVEIARRTSIDFMRRRKRWSSVVEPSDRIEAIPDLRADDPLGDPAARLEFVVLEYFRRSRSSCLEIAEAYFEARSWPLVAVRLGVRPATIRKRWSRCLARLREDARSNPSSLLDWTQEPA